MTTQKLSVNESVAERLFSLFKGLAGWFSGVTAQGYAFGQSVLAGASALIRFDARLEIVLLPLADETASRSSVVTAGEKALAMLLERAMLSRARQQVAAGRDPAGLKRGIDLAVRRVIEGLKANSGPCLGKEEMVQVATIAANGDIAIGEIIAEAMMRVGPDGAISVAEGKGPQNELTVLQGMQFQRGYLSHFFVNDRAGQRVVLEDPYLLICDQKLSSQIEILPWLELVAREKKALLVIAPSIEGEALSAVVINNLRCQLPVAAVNSPGFGDGIHAMLQDLAVLTGGSLLPACRTMPLRREALALLGRARRIEVTQGQTCIIGGVGRPDEVAAHVRDLHRQIRTVSDEYLRTKLRLRAARLANGVALIDVGAATDTARSEKRRCLEGALRATRAAFHEGVVPGGGVALLRARSGMVGLNGVDTDQQAGIDLVYRALEYPLQQLLVDGGVELSTGIAGVVAGSDGLGDNVASGKYGDLIRVTRGALRHAASVTGAMLMVGLQAPVAADDSGRQRPMPVGPSDG